MRIASFDIGIKNLAFCIIEWNGPPLPLQGPPLPLQGPPLPLQGPPLPLQWECIDVNQSSSLDQSPAEMVVRALDKFTYLQDVDCVVIERQMKRNIQMTEIGHIVQAYFLIRYGMGEKKLPIAFFPASAKFQQPEMWQYHPVEEEPSITKTKKKMNKYQRKQHAKKWCEYLINKDDIIFYDSETFDPVVFFNTFKGKQDDLADCYLQGLAYINKHIINVQTQPKTKIKIIAHKPSGKGIIKTAGNVKYCMQRALLTLRLRRNSNRQNKQRATLKEAIAYLLKTNPTWQSFEVDDWSAQFPLVIHQKTYLLPLN